MLPLLSTTRPTATGTSPRSKNEICCGLPSSMTLNADCGRLGDCIRAAVEDVDVQDDQVGIRLEDRLRCRRIRGVRRRLQRLFLSGGCWHRHRHLRGTQAQVLRTYEQGCSATEDADLRSHRVHLVNA